MRIPLIILTLVLFSSSAFANCVTNERGQVVCSNGYEAGGYNANTGRAWKSERNQNGVATTQTSAGGKANTKNGKGVVHTANGKDCYKTANNYGCN
jgi:hypothetical protein